MNNTKQNCWHIQYKLDGEWTTETSMPLTQCRKINGNPVNPHGINEDLEFCINEARAAMIVNYKSKWQVGGHITEWRYIPGYEYFYRNVWTDQTWSYEFDHIVINDTEEA